MNNDCTGIQADKPLPPWERPGCFRLDGKPHRGNLLWWLAALGFSLSLISVFIPCLGWMPALIGAGFCLTIHDYCYLHLKKMQTGEIDPRGKTLTESAAHLARIGIRLGACGAIFWMLICLLLIFFPINLDF